MHPLVRLLPLRSEAMALLSNEQPNLAIYLSGICFLISLVFLVLKFTRRTKSNLPPSPPKLPFIGNLHQLGTLPHRSFQSLSHKYGPLMLLHLGRVPTLVVSSADVAREIFQTHDVFFSNRPKVTAAEIFLYNCSDVAFAPYGEEWRKKRKICVQELVGVKSVRSFEFIRVEEVAEMINCIREACASKKEVVNLSELVIALTNNIMARCVLGQKYDTPDGRSSFGELGRKMLNQFTAFCVGDFFPSLGWVDVVIGQIPKLKATLSSIDAFFDQVVAERKMKMEMDKGESDKKDFLNILLKLEEEGTLGFDLSQDVLKALLVDMFLGASDTTSTTLEWTMAELIRNPNTMRKAQEEVRRVVGLKTCVDETDVKQMKYLKCVVKESLRLHPSAPLLLPRETRSAVKLKGYDIPAKTRVMLNAWAIQRDPEFWNRPAEFLPERFENSKVDFKGQDFEFIPFGAGRRGCAGITFGTTMAEYAIANLLYSFDWKLPKTGVTMNNIDMTEKYGITVNKKVPLLLHPIPFSL
ncbi:hypothetical protein RJT34_33242 [Clitoria ternatea]|uniref:Cytochrome P450 n=1 Tax=Clitoria ternatea TaxID=43366 RepID=A0AAN9F1N0_CLITE